GANLDSGSDDTLFPMSLAIQLGVDLTGAAEGESRVVGGSVVPYVYASASLRVADVSESYEWTAMVGFTNAPLRWAILGHTGCLEFFDVQLLGKRRESVVVPNASFPGTHRVRQPRTP